MSKKSLYSHNSFSLSSSGKLSKAISVPFLPVNYENTAKEFVQKGLSSPYRSKKFEKILRKTQVGLKDYCKYNLKKLGYEPINQDGFLYAKGEIPILLIAHMDTVHSDIPREIVWHENYVTSPQGIGGDDRCGVFIIFELIKEFNCHVLFTEDEEIGCVGADKFACSKVGIELCDNIKYCIEFDRRGKNDAVFYECGNYDFMDYILNFGYFKEEFGSFSDICYIAPALDCCAVNFSCGYYNAHTKSEYIDMKQVWATIDNAKTIIADHENVPQFVWEDYDYYNYGYGYNGYGYGYNKYYTSSSPRKEDYIIYWNSWENSCVVSAFSQEEAIGMFLMDNPRVCYDDVNYAEKEGTRSWSSGSKESRWR